MQASGAAGRERARAARSRPEGSNAERSRAHNRRLVLGHVRAAGRAGRAEIARGAGLSVQAVSNIIAELEAEGLLARAGLLRAGRGQPAPQYAVRGDGGFAFGAEVRPDALLFAALDLDGRTRFTAREGLDAATPEAVAARLAALRAPALAALGVPPGRVLGAGVVMPGPFVATGVAGAASDLAGWHGVEPAPLFAEALGVDVQVENDANAAALGERVAGVARGLDSFLYLYFGTGLGLGIVQDGALFRGALGNAGEIGHVRVPHAGGSAALEDVASRLALRRALEGAREPADTADRIRALHAARHPALLGWLGQAREALGHALGTLENLFDPEAIVFGGALPDALLDELVATLPLPERSVANRAGRRSPRVLRGASGRMTAAVGGAALVVNRTFTPQLARLGSI